MEKRKTILVWNFNANWNYIFCFIISRNIKSLCTRAISIGDDKRGKSKLWWINHWYSDVTLTSESVVFYLIFCCSKVVVTDVSAITQILVVGHYKAIYERYFSRVKFRCMGNNFYFYVSSCACISPRSPTAIFVKALFVRVIFASIVSVLLCEKQRRKYAVS